MTDRTRLNSVPKIMLPVYGKIVGLSDDVCDKHLNSEYRDLARAMTEALCRKRPSPLTSGQPRTSRPRVLTCTRLVIERGWNFFSCNCRNPAFRPAANHWALLKATKDR